MYQQDNNFFPVVGHRTLGDIESRAHGLEADDRQPASGVTVVVLSAYSSS